MNTEQDSQDPSHDVAADEIEEATRARWNDLKTQQDAEAWIQQLDQSLQRSVNRANASGYGVCFWLDHGGQIFMHTSVDAVLLDVTPEAQWAAPVITAATGIEAPRSQIWTLPDDKLTQLVLGLNSLVGSTTIVANHKYRPSRF
ncbi:MAG: hypothetical protein JWR22_2304 [Herminiimonas sp.]|jgi:hypothetical protein|nr:hypothetical protein [Herminiimonas sp.]